MKRLCMILLALGTVTAFAQQHTKYYGWATLPSAAGKADCFIMDGPQSLQTTCDNPAPVPQFAIDPGLAQLLTTVPYKDWDGKNCIGKDCLNYFDGTCWSWTVHDDVIQCAVWDRYVTSRESVNDPIPTDAVTPEYWNHEPYCPTTEYRIRWFVVEDPLSGKTFSARCVPAK